MATQIKDREQYQSRDNVTSLTQVIEDFTFSERLKFARLFICRYKRADYFAEDCGLPVSTYATWENGSVPRDQAAVAKAIEDRFPEVPALWLLLGGDLRMYFPDSDLTSTYRRAS